MPWSIRLTLHVSSEKEDEISYKDPELLLSESIKQMNEELESEIKQKK